MDPEQDLQRTEDASRRRAALRHPPRGVAEWHPEGFLEELREDWPDLDSGSAPGELPPRSRA